MDCHEWPIWCEETRSRSNRACVFSDEPGIYLEGELRVRLEDDWHVTEDGATMFTPASPSIEQPFGK